MDRFDDLQRASLAWLRPLNPSMAEAVVAVDGAYLYGTIGTEAALLRDGSVHLWVAEQWPESEDYTGREATPEERLAALVLGAERWPQLRSLLPPRPPEASDCVTCGAQGLIRNPGGVICPQWHGLGWVEPAI